MRIPFLAVYDYGSGAVYIDLFANSKEEIAERFRELKVLDQPPEWMKPADIARIRTVDADDPHDKFLAGLRR
jgi:hypothetical protein